MDRGRAALVNDDDDINADAGVVWRMATVATTNAMRRWLIMVIPAQLGDVG